MHVLHKGLAIGIGGVFVGDNPECMALQNGQDNAQLHLVDARTLERSVALETPGEFISKVLSAPDASRACAAIGVDESSRIAVFNVGVTPWEPVWTRTKGEWVLDVEFSVDGSVIACVTKGVHQVDIHDAQTGDLRSRIQFGVIAELKQRTLRFSKELLVVSGGSVDEKTVRHPSYIISAI